MTSSSVLRITFGCFLIGQTFENTLKTNREKYIFSSLTCKKFSYSIDSIKSFPLLFGCIELCCCFNRLLPLTCPNNQIRNIFYIKTNTIMECSEKSTHHYRYIRRELRHTKRENTYKQSRIQTDERQLLPLFQLLIRVHYLQYVVEHSIPIHHAIYNNRINYFSSSQRTY